MDVKIVGWMFSALIEPFCLLVRIPAAAWLAATPFAQRPLQALSLEAVAALPLSVRMPKSSKMAQNLENRSSGLSLAVRTGLHCAVSPLRARLLGSWSGGKKGLLGGLGGWVQDSSGPKAAEIR